MAAEKTTINGHDAVSSADPTELQELNCTETVEVAVYTHPDGDKIIVPGLWAKKGQTEAIQRDANVFGLVNGLGAPEWREVPFDPEKGIVSVQGVRGDLDSPLMGLVGVICIEGPAIDKVRTAEETVPGPAREDSPWKRQGEGEPLPGNGNGDPSEADSGQ